MYVMKTVKPNELSTDTIKVAITDDHVLYRAGVKTALGMKKDIQVIFEADNGMHLLNMLKSIQPDVILLDVQMPIMDGIETNKHLLKAHPDAKILVLSAFQDDDSVKAMLQSGAVGYVLKESLVQDLMTGIQAAVRGATMLSSPIAQVMFHSQMQRPDNSFELTVRELSVLRLVADGLSNKEIAAQLVISVSTVKFHLNNILEKMNVNTRSEAIVLAARHRLL